MSPRMRDYTKRKLLIPEMASEVLDSIIGLGPLDMVLHIRSTYPEMHPSLIENITHRWAEAKLEITRERFMQAICRCG